MEGGSPCSSSGDGTATPPHLQWRKSLNHLLQDAHGVSLFMQFLKDEVGSDAELQFLFACNGLRKIQSSNPQVAILVPSIFKRFLQKDAMSKSSSSSTNVMSPTRSSGSIQSGHPKIKLSSETYSMIKEKIEKKQFHNDLFDIAQKEVEDKISLTTYLSFLKSDIYLNYLDNQPGSNSPPSSNNSIGQIGKTFFQNSNYKAHIF